MKKLKEFILKNKVLIAVVLFVGLMLFVPSQAEAYQRVRGYTRRSTGTYVMPYYRSTANSYKFDNYSAKYNSNPFTGRKGYTRWY